MLDIQNIFVKSVVSINKVELVGTDPSVLQIEGVDFTKVSSVEINNIDADFEIITAQRMLVPLPEEVEEVSIKSINVFKTEPSITTSSFFEFEIGGNPRMVTGEMKMLMHFIKVMLTTPGSDIFDKSLGGNFQNWPGMRVNLANPHGLITKTVIMVTNVGLQITSRQRGTRLTPEEKLRSVDVLSVNFDKGDPSMLELKLKLVSYAGNSVFSGIALGTSETSL